MMADCARCNHTAPPDKVSGDFPDQSRYLEGRWEVTAEPACRHQPREFTRNRAEWASYVFSMPTSPWRVTWGNRRLSCDAASTRFTEASYLPGQRIPRHRHELPSVTVVQCGEVQERFDRETVRCGRADIVIKSADAYHANLYGTEGATCLFIRSEWSPTTIELSIRSSTLCTR